MNQKLIYKTEIDSEIKTGICVYDLHHPFHQKTLWENILKITADLKPDYFIFGGDNLDMDSVNHWDIENGNRRGMEGKRLKKNYDDFNEQILDPLIKLLPDSTRKIFMLGNHCQWLEQYIDKIPELEGFAEIERNLNLKDWKIIPYRQTIKIGKIYFHHGEYTSKYHAAKMVDVYERNIVYGHLHTAQSFTKVTPVDGEAHCAISIPCACDMNPRYMKDKPSAWVNGFGIFYIHPDNNFNIYTVISTKGHFVWNSKRY